MFSYLHRENNGLSKIVTLQLFGNIKVAKLSHVLRRVRQNKNVKSDYPETKYTKGLKSYPWLELRYFVILVMN